MLQRILVAILLAWVSIAPAIANACAAGCETGESSMHQASGGTPDAHASGVPDCHGVGDERDTSNPPDDSAMEAACLVASAASLPSAAVVLDRIELMSLQTAAVLLPAVSFHTSAPVRPPQS